MDARDTYYLLLTGMDGCHDADNWLGIYTDISELKKGYYKALETEKEYLSGVERVLIYEFFAKEQYRDGMMKYQEVSPEELFGKQGEEGCM